MARPSLRSPLAALAALALISAALVPSPSLARGGGGGGGGGRGGWGGAGSGGAHWGSGSYHFQNDNWQRGYQGYHPMYGEGTRGVWGNNDRFDNDTFNRQVNVNNNFYNRNYNGWNNAWRNGGYWGSRPWNAGWYGGWGGWGWWGANSAAWGLAGLATGAAITGLVNAAADNSSPVIVVPNTSYELNYGSVESVGTYGVSFNYNVNGAQLFGAANCQDGLLNGQVPGTADQAELLNAVCQVAYGGGG
ncbi:MAG: hypothetical protein ACKO5F_04780 [Synechococcus sp.]